MNEKEELADIIDGKFECCDATQISEWLIESGIVQPKYVRYWVIRDEYIRRLKEREINESCFDIKADIAAEYDLTYPSVNQIIYRYKHIAP